MEKILILDSNSLMNRAFYAIPALSNNEGVYTNAIYGFTNMLFKLQSEIKPEFIVAAFDKSAPTFRHREFTEYKAGRKKMPNELGGQFPLIKEILTNLGVDIYEQDGFEADDVIGTIAKKAAEKGIEVYIVTGDKDAFQLADDNINVIFTKKGVTETIVYNKERFQNEFGVSPIQFIDVKALMGDKSDNIPGVPGVGEKTAFKLIQSFGSLEEVLNNIDKVSGNKLKENLNEYKEQAVFSKRLATIVTDAPVELSLENNENFNKGDMVELKKILLKLGLKTTINKLPALAGTEDGDSAKEEISFNVVNDVDGLRKALNINEKEVFITYEVKDSNIYSKIEVEKIYLSYDEENYVINIKEIIDGDKLAIDILKGFMEDDKITKVIHDGKNLITALGKLGIEIKSFIFDTAIGAYLINSARSEYAVETLINEYLGEEISGEADVKNVKIVSLLGQLYKVLKSKIEDAKMEELYYNVEHPLIYVLSSMESIGFKVNESILDQLAVKFKEEISRTEKEIYELCEEEFNIGSPKQLGKILFEKMDLPVIKKTKTGYSTNADVLEKLKDKHPVIEKIIYYRQITKLNSTYVEGLKNVIDVDGNIHSSFNQTVTTTGRLSSTEPNLQNIPVKYEMGREIRKVFIPKEETDVLLSCDYSQIELRVLAHMSGDSNMIDGFNHHSDIHTKTASEVFKVPVEEVTSTMRSRAKAVNFGIIYGMSDFSLAQDLKITKKEAGEYMAIYFERYPKIKDFLQGAIDEAKEKGYVLTLLNRRRFIPEIKSSNKIVQGLGERLAMNAPIQGSAADIIKLAMVKVYEKIKEKGLKSEMILQVHDELILNVKQDELAEVKQLVIEEMENVFNLSVPLDVDANIGNSWYEAK